MARRFLVAAVVGAALIGSVDAFRGASAAEPQAPPAAQQAPPAAQQPAPELPNEVPAEPRAKPGVAGVYMCEGTNPDGSLYKGVVEIAAIDSTYLVHWMMADGAEVLGVGIVNSGILSVSYYGGTPAVAVYKIDGDRLIGEWTMGGAEGMLYSETLTRMNDQRKPSRPNRPARPSRRTPAPGTIQL